MNDQHLQRLRPYFTAVVLLAEAAHLAWEYFDGGVRNHHILNMAELPAISNWWGLLLLPALAWFLTGRIQTRIALHEPPAFPVGIALGFSGALILGASLLVAFTRGAEDIASYLFMGMTLTFGVVLPTAIASILAALSALNHLALLPGLARLWTGLRRA